VREQVRRSGIDPLTDVETVRRLAQSAVRAHDDRSLSGTVRPVEDPERVVAELIARVAGFGALQPYLDDPTVEEVWINEPARVFVARDGRHELTTTILTSAEVRDLVERMLKTSGRRVDVSSPFVDAMLPSAIGCMSCSTASREASALSTSASSSSRRRGSATWSSSAR